MSTDFRTLKQVSPAELFDGRLEKLGVREHVADETTEISRCLTDGQNYLWVYMDEEGYVGGYCRYAGNNPGRILAAVADAFDTDIVSEYEPEFWGFSTQAEWDAAHRELYSPPPVQPPENKELLR